MSVRLQRTYAVGRKLLAVLRVPVYRRALRHGVAAAVEHDAAPFGRDFRTVVDVGANSGQFALVARRRFPDAKLVCLEPLARPRERLERVLDGAGEVQIMSVVAAAEDGEAEFVVSCADDSSSLLPMTALQVRTFPGTGEASRVTVRTVRLDGVIVPDRIARPALLKIDVQGSELEVLRGASGLLHAIDEVLVECSFVELYRGQALAAEIIDFLHGSGFAIEAVCSPVADSRGRVLQADFLFSRPEEGPSPP
jgi:FkbM family methyltransferase